MELVLERTKRGPKVSDNDLPPQYRARHGGWFCTMCTCPSKEMCDNSDWRWRAPNGWSQVSWRVETIDSNHQAEARKKLASRSCGCVTRCTYSRSRTLEGRPAALPYGSRGVVNYRGIVLNFGPTPPAPFPPRPFYSSFVLFQQHRYKSLYPKFDLFTYRDHNYAPTDLWILNTLILEIRDIDAEMVRHVLWFETFLHDYLDNNSVTVTVWRPEEVPKVSSQFHQ